MCEDLANLSKCSKHKVGALLVNDNRIISNGLNGTPSGFINCCDKFANCDTHTEPARSAHREWSEKYEIHAEMNAMLFAAKHGVALNNSILYCNLEPCFNCLKHAITVGIKQIYYKHKHKNNLNNVEVFLLKKKTGIKIEQIQEND